MDRRSFILSGAAVTVGMLAPRLLAGGRSSPAEMRPGQTLRPGPALELPAWPYGDCSCGDDTMLMFRGNPSHTFYGNGPLRDNLEIAWRFRTEDFITNLRGKPKVWSGTGWTGQASHLAGYVFFGSQDRHLYCLNAENGELVWKYRGGRMFKGSVCIYRNRVYAPNVDDRLHCVDAASGELIWKFDTGRDLDSSPCVWENKLYIAGENGSVHCLKPDDGSRVWKTFVGGIGPGTKLGSNGAEGSPAVDQGQLVVGNYDGEVYCLDAETGEKVWKFLTGDDTDVSAVFSGDRVLIASEEASPYLYCLDREKGEEIWKFKNDKGFYSTPAIVGGRLYIGGNGGKFYCLNVADGSMNWEYEAEAGIWCSPAVVDEKVLFGSYANNFYILDAATGTEIQRLELGGRVHSAPIVVGGKVFVGSAAGLFYCLA